MTALTVASTVHLASGVDMPVLGLGVYQNPNPGEACRAAFAAGYRHVDSAKCYFNEAAVGRAARASGLARDALFLTSKCWNPTHGYASTLRAVEESLAELSLPTFDLYLIHDPMSGRARRLETWRALVECKKAGKVRAIGVSNYGPKHLEEIKAAGYELPDVNQIELHPFCQQRPIVEWCRANGVVVQAYCPIIRNKRDKVGHPAIQAAAQKVTHHHGNARVPADATQHGKTAPQVLIRWSLQKGYVPLPKSDDAGRIAENAGVFDFELDANEMASLDALDQGKSGGISWNPVDAD